MSDQVEARTYCHGTNGVPTGEPREMKCPECDMAFTIPASGNLLMPIHTKEHPIRYAGEDGYYENGPAPVMADEYLSPKERHDRMVEGSKRGVWAVERYLKRELPDLQPRGGIALDIIGALSKLTDEEVLAALKAMRDFG